MKNKKRFLTKLFSISGLLLGATSVIVATTVSSNSNQQQNLNLVKLAQNETPLVRQQQGGGPAPTPTPTNPPAMPTMPDPNFDTFKAIVENVVRTEFPKIVPLLTDALTRKREAIAADNTITRDVKLTRNLYLRFFSNFIEKVRTATTLQDVENLGIRFSLPILLSTDRNVTLGTVNYQGEELGSVGIGNTNKTDYKFVENDPKGRDKDGNVVDNSVRLPEPAQPTVNDISAIDLSRLVTKYVGDFIGQVGEIFLNDRDMPVDGVDVDLAADSPDGRIGIYGDKPKNFDTWEDYIKSKLTLRSTIYDLKANQEYFHKDSQDNPQPMPEDPPIPPVIPAPTNDLLPTQTPPVEVSPNIENIPSLEPLLNPTIGAAQFGGQNFIAVADNYNQGTDEEIKIKSDRNFYFFNPINTRFDYTVVRIFTQGNDYMASVRISDTANPTAFRTYTIPIKQNEFNFNQAVVDHNIYLRMRMQFVSLYDIFGIGEKQDYSKLLDSGVRQDLFNAVFLAVRTFSSDTTFDTEKKAIVDQLSQFSNIQQDTFKSVIDERSDELLSKYLEARGINTDGFTQRDRPRTFWELMGQSLEQVVNGFPFKTVVQNADGTRNEFFTFPRLKQNLENKEFIPRIEGLLKNNNFDLDTFNEGFMQLQKDATVLKEKSSRENIGFEIRKNDLKKVYEGFVRFASIFPTLTRVEGETDTTPEEEKTKIRTELIETLNNLKTYIEQSKTVDSTTISLIITLSILSALIAIAASALTVVAIKRKKLHKKSYVAISVSGIFTVTLVALIIAMVVLLFGGI